LKKLGHGCDKQLGIERLHSCTGWFSVATWKKTQLSAPFRNAIFRGIIATERCCFAQLLKVVHSVSDRYFFAPLRKAIRYKAVNFDVSSEVEEDLSFGSVATNMPTNGGMAFALNLKKFCLYL
jgi:hypothetical protein